MDKCFCVSFQVITLVLLFFSVALTAITPGALSKCFSWIDYMYFVGADVAIGGTTKQCVCNYTSLPQGP